VRSGWQAGPARWVAAVAACLAVVAGSAVMLWPVLVAPLAADQRYMYALAAGQTSGHWSRMVTIPWDQIPDRLVQGRFAPLAFVVEWISYTGVTELSITSSTSLVTMQALQKVVLLVLALLAVLAFAASLRGRTDDGGLRGLGRRRLLLVAAGTCLAGAAGVQAQLQSPNGWVTYAVLTYGAVIVDFAVIALVLWLARRRVAAPSRRLTAATVIVLALVAIGLNSSYELYDVVVPVALLALALQPVAPASAARQGRSAKLFVGGVFVALFGVCLVAVRVAVSLACPPEGCYAGTTPALGSGVFSTWMYNVGSSLPLTGRDDVLAAVRAAGSGTTPTAFGSGLAVLVVVAGAGLVVLRLLLGGGRLGGGRLGAAGDRVRRTAGARAAGTAALHGALVCASLAVASAGVMSISAQAQSVITTFGHPYRHTPVTWIALAVGVVLVVVAVDALRSPRVGLAAWTALAVLATAVGAAVLPYNLAATRAANTDPGTLAVSRVYDELVLGDTDLKQGVERRCDDVRAAKKALNGRGPAVTLMLRGVYDEYRYRYGKAYCPTIHVAPR
jgi:hypothetical protein